MNVLVVEPYKEPYEKEIDPGLESLQHEVGGDIEAVPVEALGRERIGNRKLGIENQYACANQEYFLHCCVLHVKY